MFSFLKKRRERNLLTMYKFTGMWLQKVMETPESLYSLMNIHKAMWREGLRHEALGPDRYGMFRTDRIEDMILSDIHLGGIDGIPARSAQEFEYQGFKYANQNGSPDASNHTDSYRTVCRQYRDHLASVLREMRSNIYDHGFSREEICASIEAGCGKLYPDAQVSGVRILDRSIEDGKIVNVMFNRGDDSIMSSLAIKGGIIYLPDLFTSGVFLQYNTREDCSFRRCQDALNGNDIPVVFGREEIGRLKFSKWPLEMTGDCVAGNVRHLKAYARRYDARYGF